MTTPKEPSVINPDIPPPPSPKVSAPSGDRSLSPDNSAGAPNKRSRTVSSDDMEVETTTTTTTAAATTTSGPVSGLVSTVLSDSSIHAHPLPASTIPPTNDKGKSVAFDVPKKFTTNRTMCDEVDRALGQYSSMVLAPAVKGQETIKVPLSFLVQEDHSACIHSPCADL
ncbi:unnamed protein product [Rhizophagus irregularis]|nr:unnamed protein product [Rhizophagus irregularis]